jgi:hypothetical protein
MAMIVVSVKDKICFSTLTFMKDELRKRLMIHLYLVGTCICKTFYLLWKCFLGLQQSHLDWEKEFKCNKL